MQFRGRPLRVAGGAGVIEPPDDVVGEADAGAGQPRMLVEEPDADVLERWQAVVRAEDAHKYTPHPIYIKALSFVAGPGEGPLAQDYDFTTFREVVAALYA